MRMCVDYTSLNKAYPKVLFLYHALIRLLILPQDVKRFPFLMLILVIIR